jgi:glutathione S-transferase
MTDFTLSIGSKAYSSWSLRGWLMCKLAGIDFVEDFHHMGASDWHDWVRAKSPHAKVPMLRHHGADRGRDVLIWESLAIAEYLNEIAPQAGMWPEGQAARAHARAISNEMHAGFAALRTQMWMTLLTKRPGKGRTPESLADIARIVDLWRDTLGRFGAGGPYLFGDRFTIADAMYAPVVIRFWAWEPDLPEDAKAYCAAVWDHPFVAEWRSAAVNEKPVARYEALSD